MLLNAFKKERTLWQVSRVSILFLKFWHPNINHFLLRLTHSVMSTLSNPMDCSAPGSSVYGIHQARELENSHWSGLPMPPPGDLRDSGFEPMSPVSPALPSRFFTTSASRKAHIYKYIQMYHVYIKYKMHLCVHTYMWH